MKKLKYILAFIVAIAIAAQATAQIGDLKKLKGKIPATKKVSDVKTETPSTEQFREKVSEEAPVTKPEAAEATEDTNNENIRFSTTPIDPENPGKFSKQFKAGEYLYAIVNLPKIIDKYFPDEKPGKAVNMDIFLYTATPPPPGAYYKEDRELQLTFTNIMIPASQRSNDYLLVEIAPDPAFGTVYSNPEMKFRKIGPDWTGPAALSKDIGGLEPGKYKIRMEVHLHYQPVATGSFRIAGDDFGFYTDLSKQLVLLADEGGAAGEQFPKARKSDPELEKRMIAAFKNSNHFKDGRFDVVEILKIAIYDSDWNIRRHEFSGVITERYIRAAIAAKGKDGKCGYYNVTFKEDYVGGKFQPMKYDGASERKLIKCENLK